MMHSVTIYEFDTLLPESAQHNERAVPQLVFDWLEIQCLKAAEKGDAPWLKIVQRKGRRAVQVTSFVGVIRAPNGFQIEVLPKIGKANEDGPITARRLLIDMLRCLDGFRHIQTNSAHLAATRMPLFEVFIREFLLKVQHIVKKGLRSHYVTKKDNLFSLRGKLLISQHIRQNVTRADRFFTEHDEFSPNRPENRLLHLALQKVLKMSTAQENQRLAQELRFVFADIPESTQVALDFQHVSLDRGMEYYAHAIAWAKLILEQESPLTGSGNHQAPSLLFPMEAVFEAFVTKHLARQLNNKFSLKAQVKSHHLVTHQNQKWFRLKPDFVIQENKIDRLVLDAKWKLLDEEKSNGKDKYLLAQGDFYQLYAYGQSYLNGQGNVVLIYPLTDMFMKPLNAFHFQQAYELSLWVVPFCLESKKLLMQPGAPIVDFFSC